MSSIPFNLAILKGMKNNLSHKGNGKDQLSTRCNALKSSMLWFDEDTPGALWHDHCFFIRHGETSWNNERRIMGWQDIALNDTGLRQAYEARHHIKGLGIQTICTSPLRRAHQTATILNEVLDLPLKELSNLKEMGGGDYEGQIRMGTEGHFLKKSRQGFPADNAEPYDTFETRVVSGLKESLANPGPVLIVSHGGVFWALATYFDWPVDKLLDNCEVVQIFFPRSHGDWVIRQVA